MKNTVDLITLITLHNSDDSTAKQAVDEALQPIISDQAKLRAALTQQDSDGNSPLHWAIEYELLEATKYILTAAATNNLLKDILILKDSSGNSPLNAAIIGNKDPKIINSLFNNLFDHPGILKEVLQLGNNEGTIALHAIIGQDKTQLLSNVLAEAKSKNVIKDLLEVQDKEGKTALHKGAFEEKGEVIDVILQTIGNEAKLQDNIFAQDRDGNSPLHWAVEIANVSIVTKFMGKVSEGMLLVTDNSGNTPLNAAIIGKKGNAIIKAILDKVPVGSLNKVLLLSNDPKDPDSNPLKAIIATNNKEIFKVITDKADILSLQAQQGKSLYQTAEYEDATDIKEYLGQLISKQCKLILHPWAGYFMLSTDNVQSCTKTIKDGIYTLSQLSKCDSAKVLELISPKTVAAIQKGTYTADQLLKCETTKIKLLTKEETITAIKDGVYKLEDLLACDNTTKLDKLTSPQAIKAIKDNVYTADQLLKCEWLKIHQLIKDETTQAITKGTYKAEDLIKCSSTNDIRKLVSLEETDINICLVDHSSTQIDSNSTAS